MANKSLVLTGVLGDWVIQNRDVPQPEKGEVLVRTKIVALNPVEWKIREHGFGQNFPTVLGSDVAGIVEAVGPDVSLFKPGDRVLGFTASQLGPNQGAFQEYVVVNESLTSLIPEEISFLSAATMPMALVTAAGSLHDLGVNLPFAPKGNVSGTKAVLIWGGSTTMGLTAIQMARAAGATIFTTSSTTHFARLKSLGADYVFDYHSATVAEDILRTVESAGITINKAVDCASAEPSLTGEVFAKMGGGDLALLANPDAPMPDGVKSFFSGARVVFSDPAFSDFLFHKYLGPALESGKLVPAAFEIIPGGLSGIEAGLAKLKAGVSGIKLVVEL